MATQAFRPVKASMMNAIHDLPLLVARDAGFFRDEGLDVEIVKTPGTGQRGADHQALRDNIFTRTMENLYEQGACDQFRMCEWGIMKRAVESNVETGHRPAKIVALGSAMSTFAIVVDPKSRIYEPEQLKNRPIAVSPFNGSHFTMLKMLEGFLNRDQIKWVNAGTHEERVKALRSGEVAAAEAIQSDPGRYAHYLIEEAGGLLEPSDLKLARILNAPPEPYTRERFDHTYQWTLGWGLVAPGATYENTVDNRAWQ